MKIRYIAIAVAAACAAGAGHAEILSLHAAWQKAAATEPAWRVAQADASIDRAESNKARAGLLPQVGLSGSRNRNSLTQSSNAAGTTDYGSSSTSLSLRQPLFRMQSYAEYQRAGARGEGAEFRLGNEAQSLAVRVSQAYFEVLQSEDAIRYSAYLEQSLATHVDAARKAFRSGSGTRIDIDEARARLALATSDRQAAENANGNARKRLSAIVGVPVTELLPLDEDRIKGLRLTPASFAEWVELARQQSPELAAAAKSVDEASWSVKTARSGHLPTLDLVMSRSKADSDSISTINNAYTSNTIGVQLNIPIFSGGFTTADTTQAAARYQRAIAARDNTDRQLETRLLQEFNGVMQGEERLASLATALEASREALRATHHGVAAGTRTSLDVLNAERQLYSTRLDISKARYDWLMSRIRLHALAGKLGEAEIREVSGLLSLAAGRDRTDMLAAGSGLAPTASPPPRDSVLRAMPTREVGAAGYAAQAGTQGKAEPATPTAAPADPVAPVAVGQEPAAVRAEPKLATSLGAAGAPAAAAAQTPAPPASDGAAAQTPGTMAKIGAFLSGLFVATDQPAASATATPAEPAQPADVTPAESASAAAAAQAATAHPAAAKPIDMPAAAAIAPAAAPSEPPAPPPAPAAAAEASPRPTLPAATAEDARKTPIIRPSNKGAYVVALGAYADARNVRRVLSSAGKMGIAAYTEPLRSGLTRVRAGPFATRQAANKARNKLKAGGIAGVVDKR